MWHQIDRRDAARRGAQQLHRHQSEDRGDNERGQPDPPVEKKLGQCRDHSKHCRDRGGDDEHQRHHRPRNRARHLGAKFVERRSRFTLGESDLLTDEMQRPVRYDA